MKKKITECEFENILLNFNNKFISFKNTDYFLASKYNYVFDKYAIKSLLKYNIVRMLKNQKNYKKIKDKNDKIQHLLGRLTENDCTEDEIIQLLSFYSNNDKEKEADSIIALLKSNNKLTFNVFQYYFMKRHT